MALFSFESEPVGGYPTLFDSALKGAGTKGKYSPQLTGIDNHFTVTVVFAAQQPDELERCTAVKIASGIYMEVSVVSFECHLKVGTHF
ncbi:MAG: hypothetical protein PVH87_19240 [Desulfobacteraceae bacterium]|jgi:hypothetical protein